METLPTTAAQATPNLSRKNEGAVYPEQYRVEAPDHAVVDFFVMIGHDGLHVSSERCRDLSNILDTIVDFVRKHLSDAFGTRIRALLSQRSLRAHHDLDIRIGHLSVLGSMRYVAYGDMVGTLSVPKNPYRDTPFVSVPKAEVPPVALAGKEGTDDFERYRVDLASTLDATRKPMTTGW